jgi:NAD(P)-dependent dehydrogenase (short-subunit alcohol dehydrogenase family)
MNASTEVATKQKVCLIVGAGDATGSAIAKRFVQAGFTVCVARRTPDASATLVQSIQAAGGRALDYQLDARREEEVSALFKKIESEVGNLEVVVFNVGGNVRLPLLEMTAEKYFKTWEMCAMAGFLVGREAARVLLPKGRGTILFTGATASLRGGVGFSAFAGGKAALRALAQSMAREFGPQGLHIAHVVVDGVIDSERVRNTQPERVAALGDQGLLEPDSIARAYLWLHEQTPDAWTFELDLRPGVEKW